MSLPDDQTDAFVEQYLRHYDRYWFGLQLKLIPAAKLVSAALAAEGVKFEIARKQMVVYRALHCHFWGKRVRKKPADRNDFSAKEWERMDQWLERHPAIPFPTDAVVTVMRMMLKDRVTTSLSGAREAILWRHRTAREVPPPFKFDPSLVPAKKD